jgi:hypothetical protein
MSDVGTAPVESEVVQDTVDGDHDRMTHIVLEHAGNSVVEGMVNQTPVRALCGKRWVPGRNPARYPLCPTCREIAASMGWRIPTG